MGLRGDACVVGYAERKPERHFSGVLKGRVFAVWGLAFKPNTDDMREAPAVTLIELLLKAGASVRAYDPVAGAEAARIFKDRSGLTLTKSAYEAATGADALAIVTEWQEFRSPDFERLKETLKAPVIFDGRNLYDPALMKALEFTYYSVGRRPVHAELEAAPPSTH